MSNSLPLSPSLEQLRKQAKDLRRAWAGADPAARTRVRAVPELARLDDRAALTLAQAQLVVARELGFESWPRLKRHVESLRAGGDEREARLIDAALSGDFAAARELLELEPALATASLYAACALGEAAAAEAFLARDPGLAGARGGPKQREPLLYLAFSRFLRADARRADGMLAIARALLARGADANAFFAVSDDPNERQTALYGAAGLNNHAGLTRLLLEAGADPNDRAPGVGPESLYHACEFKDLTCLRLILEARPRRDIVSYCLARMLDFESYEGARLFLEHGADPNFATPHDEHRTRLHHAIVRDRSLAIVELLLDAGADPNAVDDGGATPYLLAVRQGRDDVAALLLRRGARGELSVRDRLLNACARADAAAARGMLADQPGLLASLSPQERSIFTDAAWRGRVDVVRALLELGFQPGATDANGATLLHAAAFRGEAELAKLLLERGAPVELRDQRWASTPLGWALAGVQSTLETNPSGDYAGVVNALLAAGALLPEAPDARATLLRVARGGV